MPMPQGDYCGMLLEAETSELDNAKRTPLMYVTFKVGLAAENGQWVQIEPVERDVKLFLSDKAWPYSEKKLRALGFNGDFARPDFSETAKTEWVKLTCKHDQSSGTDQTVYEDWDLADWGGGKDHKEPESDTVRKLNALWKQSESANAKPAGSPPPASAPPASPAPQPPADVDESSIPF